MTRADKETLLFNYAEAQGLLSSKQDIEAFNEYVEENITDDKEERFDYVIMDECNRWISTGFQQTQEQIDQEVEELVSNTDLEIFVFQAKELTRTSFQGAL